MPLRVMKETERTGSRVNDRIVIRYLAARETDFARVLLKHEGVIEGVSEPEPDGAKTSVRRVIYLNRPDSLEEDEIGRYIAKAKTLKVELNEISLSTQLYIHDFSIPA